MGVRVEFAVVGLSSVQLRPARSKHVVCHPMGMSLEHAQCHQLFQVGRNSGPNSLNQPHPQHFPSPAFFPSSLFSPSPRSPVSERLPELVRSCSPTVVSGRSIGSWLIQAAQFVDRRQHRGRVRGASVCVAGGQQRKEVWVSRVGMRPQRFSIFNGGRVG